LVGPENVRRPAEKSWSSDVLGKMRHLARVSYHYLFPTTVFRRYIERHGAEEIEIDYLDILVDRNRAALDVGANLGRYTAPLAGRATHVWAFEPHPRLARILRKSLRRNVTVIQAAVSNRHGSTELRVPLRQDQHVESLATVEPMNSWGAFRTITVPILILDDFCERDIGFVKIDVEGHELNVIEGGLKLLASQHPIVLVEADEHHRVGTTTELFGLMASVGYRGLFIWQGGVCELAEFDPATMQNEQNILPGTPRRLWPYVSNFIFAPAGAAFSSIRQGIAERMARQAS
jgi:FkbM family methyltransferase